MGTGRRAVLDLGSNSFHLLVADVDRLGRIRRVATEKRQLRLAEPVTRTGSLGKEARARAEEAIAGLLGVAAEHGAQGASAVATDAIRRAQDGDAFRDDLREHHGLEVRVLTGEEEAILSTEAMRTVLGVPVGIPLLGLDLGGGSFDLAVADGREVLAAVSTPHGAAAATAGFRHDPPWLAEVAELHGRMLDALRPAAEALGRPVVEAAGTAGTIRDLGRAALAAAGQRKLKEVRGLVVERAALETAVRRLLAIEVAGRPALDGVSEKRADILPAGGIVVLAAMEAFGVDRLTLCDWGLREGVLLAEAVAVHA